MIRINQPILDSVIKELHTEEKLELEEVMFSSQIDNREQDMYTIATGNTAENANETLSDRYVLFCNVAHAAVKKI